MQSPLVIIDRRGLSQILLFILLMSGFLTSCFAPKAEEAMPEPGFAVPPSIKTPAPTLIPKHGELIFVEFYAVT